MDHILGLILLGLGVQSPFTGPSVKGDSTVATASAVTSTTSGTFGGVPTTNTGLRPLGAHPDIVTFKSTLSADRANFLDDLEKKREFAQNAYQASMSAFQKNLTKIQDVRKHALLVKLNTFCQDINTKRTAKMSDMLTKLTDILTNITNRAATAQTAGKDITAVTTSVATAQQAITDAQTAVSAQAGTSCVLMFKSETSLRADVGYTISSMESTLKGIYTKVLAARTAVVAALKALAQVTGEPLTGVSGSASPSATTH